MVGEFDNPDISNAVRVGCEVLFRAESHPLKSNAWCFRFTYQKRGINRYFFSGFADADYASKATDRRSVSGGAIKCEGACKCWFSRTQKCVTLSTC